MKFIPKNWEREKKRKQRKNWRWALNIHTNTEKKMFLKSCECLTHRAQSENIEKRRFFRVVCVFSGYRVVVIVFVLSFVFCVLFFLVWNIFSCTCLMFSSQISNCSVSFFFLSFLPPSITSHFPFCHVRSAGIHNHLFVSLFFLHILLFPFSYMFA